MHLPGPALALHLQAQGLEHGLAPRLRGFEVDQAVRRKQWARGGQGRLHRLGRCIKGRVQKHHIPGAGRGRAHPGQRIGLLHLHLGRAQALHLGTQRLHQRHVALQQAHRRCPARGRLQPERAGAGKGVEAAPPAHILPEPVE